MQFDRASIDKLLSLDDETFKSLTRTIAEAAGANQAKTEVMLNNPDMLKKRISRMNENEAQQLINAAGKEKSEEILRMLRERGVDLG